MTQVVDKPTSELTPPTAATAGTASVDAPVASAAAQDVASPERGVKVQLNEFQILMRRWSQLHAYNAGQVVRVSGPADKERWRIATEGVIRELKLGKARFAKSDWWVEYLPVEEVPVENGGRDLETFFNEELNRPFAAGELPIRFCILPAERTAGGEESHYLAAVYDHWIADSRAMRELMHRIFERYQKPEAEGRLPALTLQAPTFKKLFGRYARGWKRWWAFRESLKNICRHRHGYRLPLRDPVDLNSRFMFRELSEGLINRLYKFAKNRGASVNDLFVAVVGQAVGQITAKDRLGKIKKPLHFSRQQVGVGTIVDIRDAASEPLEKVFGLYLSSYAVLLDNPEQRSVETVMKETAAETGRIKKTFETVRRYWALAMARFSYDMYESSRFRASLLHKTVPHVAGISNVNMTGSWADGKAAADTNGTPGPRVLNYLRISPAGPLSPLVFTLTTIGGRLSLCVTYRTAAFREERAREVVDDFVRRLEAIQD